MNPPRVGRRLALSLAARGRAARAWAAAARRPSTQRDVVVQIGKSALAAGVAWEAAARLLHGPKPFYAPLAALLTVYTTVFRSVVAAAQRVVGVLLGIVLAYLLAQALPLSGFTVALVVCLSLAVSRWRRLGDQSSQVPVTALLLLLLGRADPSEYALARVLETALGAGVGVAVNILIAPPTHVRAATDAVRRVADGIADLLGEVAEEVVVWPPEETDQSVSRARELPKEIASARETLARARDSQRLNPRNVIGRTPALSGIESTLDTLEHIAVLTRTTVRMLHDAAGEDNGTGLDEAFLRPYADLLRCAGQAVRELSRSRLGAAPQADRSAAPPVADYRQQADTLAQQITSAAGQGRDRLLSASLLAELDRLLAELDPT